MKSRFDKYIAERKTIHANDSFATYKKSDELIGLLSENENETINLIRHASKEEIDCISEVMEEVSVNLNSEAYISVLQEVDLKYPECKLNPIIEICVRQAKL